MIKIQNIKVTYDNLIALHDTSLDIDTGIICALVGMNGAGKSTLFKTIMGLITPQHGTVVIDGATVIEAQKKSRIAYVPQSEDIDWTFPITVNDVVMMGQYADMNFMRQADNKHYKNVTDALEKVDILALADRQIGELSGGQKKRVFIARALAQKADILLLDEPFSGVDARTEQAITKLLIELKTSGHTIIISTHELTSLTDYCDYIAFIKKTVIAYGPAKVVFTKENIQNTFDGVIHRLRFD